MVKVIILCSDKDMRQSLTERFGLLGEIEEVHVDVETSLTSDAEGLDLAAYDIVVTDSTTISRQHEAIVEKKGVNSHLLYVQPEVTVKEGNTEDCLKEQILVPISKGVNVDYFLKSLMLFGGLNRIFTVKSKGALVTIRVDEILYIEGLLKRSIIVCRDRLVDTKEKLDSLEQKIHNRWFLRIDSSLLVNQLHIKEYHDTFKLIELVNGTFLDIEQSKRKSAYRIYVENQQHFERSMND